MTLEIKFQQEAFISLSRGTNIKLEHLSIQREQPSNQNQLRKIHVVNWK